jgi:hypothetical protein
MPFVYYVLFLAIGAVVILFFVGRWRTESGPAGAGWKSFGCGVAIALAVMLVLFGMFIFFATGMAGVCCF